LTSVRYVRSGSVRGLSLKIPASAIPGTIIIIAITYLSTLDSIFNSVSTLWSIDIYKRHLRPEASERDTVRMGKISIWVSLLTGVIFGLIVIYVKFGNPGFPLTHWFNAASYYVKNAFVIIVVAAMFLYHPNTKLVLFTMFLSVIMTYLFQTCVPEMNYFVRTSWVIVICSAIIAIPTIIKSGFRLPEEELFVVSHRGIAGFGIILGLSLIAVHIVFH